jgi:hypothetical protein
MRPIPPEALAALVAGVNLAPGSLRDQFREGETLLVFLRHFGCMFCRETVSDLREAFESVPDYPDVLFVFQGSPMEGRAFMRRYWPQARAVADPERRLYTAFGLERGSLLQTLGPAVWRAKRRAAEKGHANGPRVGDIWMMPGAFLVRKSEIVWAHEYRHAADHPEFRSLPTLATQTR